MSSADRYAAWNRLLIPSSKQARAARAADAAARARARAAAAAAAGPAPPTPPGQDFIDRVFPDYEERTEDEWKKLLDARVKPFEDAITKARTAEEGRSEFQYDQATAANQGLSTAFLGMVTGGKTGAEAEAYAKENFGTSYLPAQAISLGHQHLTKLTADWKDSEWEISTRYQKAFAEVPGLREEIRASVERGDTDEYTRKFQYANLVLDEMWNAYNAKAKQYNTDQQLAAAKDAIRIEQNRKGYATRKDAVAEAAKFADDTNTIWTVVQNADGSWSAKDTLKKKPVKPGSAASEIPAKNAAISEAKYRTANDTNVWIPKKVAGVWTAVRTDKKKKNTGANTKKEDALNKAEADLGVKVQTELRDDILGKPAVDNYGKPIPGQRTGGMGYETARAYLTSLANSALKGRSKAYIDGWVNAQLRVFFPQGTTDMRGGP